MLWKDIQSTMDHILMKSHTLCFKYLSDFSGSITFFYVNHEDTQCHRAKWIYLNNILLQIPILTKNRWDHWGTGYSWISIFCSTKFEFKFKVIISYELLLNLFPHVQHSAWPVRKTIKQQLNGISWGSPNVCFVSMHGFLHLKVKVGI